MKLEFVSSPPSHEATEGAHLNCKLMCRGGFLPQLRQNIITGDWVVITPERAKRPSDYHIDDSKTVSDAANCPFCDGCKGNEKVHGAGSDNFFVIKNKYPAFVENENKVSIRSYYPEKGFYRARAALGDHEVIIARDHDQSLIHFSIEKMTEMFQVFRQRYQSMAKNSEIVSILPFYNHGATAGASISHPHAQIIASGVAANTVGRELDGAEKYFGINGSCVFCDIIEHEQHEKVRIVAESKSFVAATFYAARFPIETWVYPKKHASQFENSSHEELQDLARVMSNVLQRMERNIPHIPLNFYIHTLPTMHAASLSYHWHLEITPRLANYAGYELGSGVIIDIISPEDAAEYLRKPGNNSVHK